MVELRKRKAPAEAAPAPPPKKSSNPVKKALDAAKDAVIGNSASSEGAANGSAKIAVGQTIALEGFGGELETHTGDKVTLSKLLEQSQAGVVIFTYPKANTPGCKSTPFSTVNRRIRIKLERWSLGGGLRLKVSCPSLLTSSKAPHKHASSGTTTLPSLLQASRSMG
jgi:hypothetical protein